MDIVLNALTTAVAVYCGLMMYYYTKRLLNQPQSQPEAREWVDDSEPDDPAKETREERLAREREQQRGFYS